MKRAGHIDTDVIFVVRSRHRYIRGPFRERRMTLKKIAEADATPLDDGAPAFDAFELGYELSLRQSVDIGEGQGDGHARAAWREPKLPAAIFNVVVQAYIAIRADLLHS